MLFAGALSEGVIVLISHGRPKEAQDLFGDNEMTRLNDIINRGYDDLSNAGHNVSTLLYSIGWKGRKVFYRISLSNEHYAKWSKMQLRVGYDLTKALQGLCIDISNIGIDISNDTKFTISFTLGLQMLIVRKSEITTAPHY